MKRKTLLLLLMLALGAPWAAWAQTSFTLNQNITQLLSPGSYSFYDSGGSSDNYSNNESYTATFTAPGPITINFSSFATESSPGCSQWDYMYIYDGTTSGTQLAKGQTGCSSANLATGTNYTASSGTMTITWHSDVSTTAAGWEATITVAFQSPSDGFESGGWNTVNGSCTNKWYIGAPGKHSGSNGLFISNDSGSSNAYTNTSTSVVYAYKNVTLDAGTYNLTFDLKQNGESYWDCVGAMLYDNATTPSASTEYGSSGLNDWPSGYSQFIVGLGYAFSGNKWKTSSTNFTVETAGTYKLTFCWKNDSSGGDQAPAAIDNVCLKKVYNVTTNVSPSTAGTATMSYTYDFNDGSLQGWTTFGADSDIYSWIVTGDLPGYTSDYSNTHTWGRNSTVGVLSGSFINGIGALSPDNYLVSPQVQLGGSISFYARSLQGAYPEHIGVAVSTTSNISGFTTIQAWDTPSNNDYQLYTVDLSSYAGQTGWIAIRNFNTNDQYCVIVDDITIVEGSATSFNRVLPASASGTVTTTGTAGLTFLGWDDNGQLNNSTSYSYAVNSANHSLTAVYESAPTTVPYAETFESNDHGWIMLNGSCTNKWVRGSNGAHDGNNGLFITNDGNSNTYNTSTSSIVYAYRSITFDAAGTYNLSFDLRQQGESTWDCVGAMLYNSSTTPSPSTSYGSSGLTSWPSGYSLMIGGAGISQSGGNWVTISWDFDVSTSGTYKLVLAWKNDSGGGTQPPASIDNVKVQRFVTISASANPAAGGNVTFLTGDGGTTTNSYLPCYTYYNYNHSQQIYTPADIGAVGTINSIAFYNGGSTKTLTSFDVYMVHTGKAEFSSTSDWIAVTSGDLVYSGTNVEMTAGQWITLTLSNSFTYNGTSNLAIVICEYMSWSSGLACRVYTPSTGGYCSLYQANDSNAYDPTNPSGSGTRLTVKNQILFNPFDGNLTRVFPTGTFCTFIEEPNTDYHFEDWTENGSQVSTNEVYTISNITGNHTVVANFAPNTHTLTASVNPANSGTISDGNNNISGATTYNHGTSVTLTATPNTGYDFIGWMVDGLSVGITNPTTVTMDQDHSVVANFQLQRFTISASANPSAGGSVVGAGTYNYNASCTLTATANSGYVFENWTENGSVVSTSANYTFTVTAARTLVANFRLNEFQITVSANPSAGGTVSGGGTYTSGTSCTVSTTVNSGYTFDGWYESNSRVSTSTSYTFTVTAARTLEARFTQDTYIVSVSANPSTCGTVSGGGTFTYGDNCTLVATPNAATSNTTYTFTGWYENDALVQGAGATYTFSVTAARTLEARFTASITKDITGHGGNNDHWYLITSPLNDPVAPGNVTNMVASTDENYDLFSFKQDAPVDPETGLGLEWINYKETAENGGGFTLEAGKGYLYANYNTVQLQFTGVPYQDNGAGCVSVYLTHTTGYNWSDWNLVGNPYNGNAYLDGPFYKMNPEGTEIVAVENSDLDAVIGPMEGVFVKYDEDEGYVAATFSTASGAKVASLALNVTKDRGLVDRAYLSFGGKHSLPKFQLNPSHTKVYIPKDDKDYAVAIAESDMGELPVNFKAEKNGTYNISVNAEDVAFGYLHLIDNKTGADVDLLANPSYSFNAATTDYASRFKLVFATANSDGDNFAFYSNGSFVISNDGEATLQVMDVTGRIVKSETLHGCASVSVNAAPGVYMLRLVNGESERVQKVVVR